MISSFQGIHLNGDNLFSGPSAKIMQKPFYPPPSIPPANEALRLPIDGRGAGGGETKLLRTHSKITSHFIRRCISFGCVAKARNIQIFPRFRALPKERLNN
jgi:hypothetical protein